MPLVLLSCQRHFALSLGSIMTVQELTMMSPSSLWWHLLTLILRLSVCPFPHASWKERCFILFSALAERWSFSGNSNTFRPFPVFGPHSPPRKTWLRSILTSQDFKSQRKEHSSPVKRFVENNKSLHGVGFYKKNLNRGRCVWIWNIPLELIKSNSKSVLMKTSQHFCIFICRILLQKNIKFHSSEPCIEFVPFLRNKTVHVFFSCNSAKFFLQLDYFLRIHREISPTF